MKRVYIDPSTVASSWEKLLAALEAKARQRDCHTLRLETGIHQHASHRPTRATATRPLRVCAVSTRSAQRLELFATFKRSAINAPAGGFGAPAPHQPVVSQRHSSASGRGNLLMAGHTPAYCAGSTPPAPAMTQASIPW